MIMKHLIDVRKNAVIAYLEDELMNVHYRAKVDGLNYAYHIVRNTHMSHLPCDDWFKRGGQYVRYHAGNQGDCIEWLPVTQDFIYWAMERQEKLELEQWLIMREQENAYLLKQS